MTSCYNTEKRGKSEGSKGILKQKSGEEMMVMVMVMASVTAVELEKIRQIWGVSY